LVEAAVFSELGWPASVSSGHELYAEELEVDAAPIEFQFCGRCGDWSTFDTRRAERGLTCNGSTVKDGPDQSEEER